MSAGQLAGAVNRLVEITESMQDRMEAIERRLSVLTGEAPRGYTFDQVAALLPCHPKTVARRVASGEWGYFLVGSEKRIPKSELVRITAARFSSPNGPTGPLPKRRTMPSDGAAEAAKIRAASRKRR